MHTIVENTIFMLPNGYPWISMRSILIWWTCTDYLIQSAILTNILWIGMFHSFFKKVKEKNTTRSSSIAGLFLRFNLVRWLFAFVCAFLRSFEWAASRNYFVLARNCVLCALICRRYVHWLLFCEAKRKNFYQRTPKKGLLRSSNKRYNVRRNNWNEGRR